ncbi:MAG TPA: hypothetical protein VGM03_17355, partial [Phycisphaerae bacterium]
GRISGSVRRARGWAHAINTRGPEMPIIHHSYWARDKIMLAAHRLTLVAFVTRRRMAALAAALCLGGSLALPARAAERGPGRTPPARPAQLTVEQYQALQEISAAPEHASARQVPASYSQQAYNTLQDPSSYITYFVVAGTVIGLIIGGGPY